MRTFTLPVAGILISLACGCAYRAEKPDGSGTIESTQVRVAAEVGGRIAQILFEEGDAVKAGQKLAAIEATTCELKRNEAKAALAQAQAQLDLMAAGSRDEDVQRAAAQVREAQAVASAAAADLKRIAEVFARQSATQKQKDDAQANADRTAAALAAAQQSQAKVLRGNRQEEIRAAQAAVELAQARLAQAEKAVADCVVLAPMAGTITTKSAETGEVLAAGAPLATLTRLDEVWLSIYVSETRLPGLRLGQTAAVSVDGDPRRHAGQVTFISPEAEFTPKNVQTPEERVKLVYRVKITLKNPSGVFKPGMPADGYLGVRGDKPSPPQK
jgi:HlyD family secretion protein